MSLDKLREIGDAPTGGSGSTSSGSSSSSYPKEQQRVPFLVIYEDRDGTVKAARQPQQDDLQLTYLKEDKHSSWELQHTPDYFLRYWMNRDSFAYARHIVEDVTGANLHEIIREDPEKAVNAVIECSKVYDTDRELPETERCPVCREELHVIFDDWQKVNGRRACPDHTLGELKDSDILDRGGVPRNRLWE